MATVLDLNFDGSSDGTAANTTNTAAGGTGAFDAIETGSTFTSTYPQHGALGLLSPASASGYARKDFSSKTVSYRVGFRFTTNPVATGDLYLFRLGVGATAYITIRVVTGTGKLRVQDYGAVTYTATNALAQDTDYWLEINVDSGTTTSNGKITCAYYPKDSSSAVETLVNSTSLNAGNGVTFTRAYMLKYGAVTATVAHDDLKLTTDFATIGPASSNATVTAVPASITVAAVAPAVSAIFSATVAAAVASLSLAAVAPSVEGEAGVSGGGPISITVATPAPGVSAVRNASVAAVAPSVSLSAVAPGVSAQGNASVAPGAVSVAVAAIAPAVSGVAQGSVSAVPVAITAAAVAPSFNTNSSGSVQAAAASVSVAAVAPSASGQRQPTTAPPAATITVTAPAPTVLGQRNPPSIAAPAVAVTVSGVAPALLGQQQPDVQAVPVALEVAMPAPSASSVEAVVVEVPAMALSLAMVKPTAWVELPAVPADHRMRVRWESRTMVIRYQEVPMRVVEHDPDATLPYQWDWADPDLLGRTWLGDDTIASYDVESDDVAMTVDSVISDGTKVSCVVAGGTLGNTARLRCRITTTNGRTDDRTMLLAIRQR